jgi:hypothetical protein
MITLGSQLQIGTLFGGGRAHVGQATPNRVPRVRFSAGARDL